MKRTLAVVLSVLLLMACIPLGAVAVSATTEPSYDGYIYDGDFESGFFRNERDEYYYPPKGWWCGVSFDYSNFDPENPDDEPELITNATITTAAAHSGRYGAHLHLGEDNTWEYAMQASGIRLGLPRVTYVLSFWCKVNSGTLTWKLGLNNVYDDTIGSDWIDSDHNSGDWTYVEWEFVMPAVPYDPDLYEIPFLSLSFWGDSDYREDFDAYVDDVRIACSGEMVVEDNLMYTIVEKSAVLQGFYQAKINEYGDPLECVNVVVPSYVNGYPVTAVNDGAFYGCHTLASIELPCTVTTIGDYAFRECPYLYQVSGGEGLIEIGDGAFTNSSLERITIPQGVTTIGVDAFYSCYELTSLPVARNNLDYCSIDGVLYDKDVTTLLLIPTAKTGAYTIPDSVTTIAEHAIGGCGLTELTIGNGVTSIPPYAACSSYSLRSVTLGDNVTTIGDYAFSYCRNLISVSLPASITTIGNRAFYTSYYQPIIVYYGGDEAQRQQIDDSGDLWSTWHYLSCVHRYDDVRDVECNRCGETRNVTGSGTTGDCTWTLYENGCLVISGNGAMADYDTSTRAPWNTSVACVTIEEGVTSIGNYAFYNRFCDTLFIPSTVTSVGDYAFYGCSYLRDVYFPGLEDQWKAVSVGANNYRLNSVVWHYHWGQHFYNSVCDPDCNVCGEERFVPDHIYDNRCDANCNECGWYREVEDHQYEIEWKMEPTCVMGFTIYCCTRCGHSYEVISPATGVHTYDAVCDADCNVCGAVRAAEDHVYDHRFDTDCNLCGETRTAYGDADGDGEITALDVILLQEHFAGYDVTLNEVGADTDGDGEITALDVILLQQYFAGYEG